MQKRVDTLPNLIRVSVGSAIVLGLADGKLDAEPTTAYLMTYTAGKCTANCLFCPQARDSRSSAQLLSRVTWPTYPAAKVTAAVAQAFKAGKIRRVCIQALNYPAVFADLEALVAAIKAEAAVPLSVSCQPLKKANIKLLRDAGVDRLGVALDGANQGVFDGAKGEGAGGPYRWSREFQLLGEALEVFGRGNVSTHLIVGLGETEQDAAMLVQRCVDLGVLPALFAFTPVHGTAMEGCKPPTLESYRRIQLARYLMVQGVARAEGMMFDKEGKLVSFGLPKQVLEDAADSGEAFRTSGCQGCNRPFYNEKPSGPIYNYPRRLSEAEVEAAKRQLGLA